MAAIGSGGRPEVLGCLLTPAAGALDQASFGELDQLLADGRWTIAATSSVRIPAA